MPPAYDGARTTAVVSALALVAVAHTYATVARRVAHDRAEWIRRSVWAAVLAAWPAAWMYIGGRFCCAPAYVGLAWPFAMLAADAHLSSSSSPAPAPARGVPYASALRIEPGALLSVTFAIAGILGAAKDVQHVRFFVAPAVLLVALALPQPTERMDADAQVATHALQAALVACATGLVLSGALYSARQPSASMRSSA